MTLAPYVALANARRDRPIVTTQYADAASAPAGGWFLVDQPSGADNGLYIWDSGPDQPRKLQGGVVPVSGWATAGSVTTDRNFDANDTTMQEHADITGTLIADLKTAGILET